MAEYVFKTIYFARDRVRAGRSARITISLPAKPTDSGLDAGLISYLKGLSSRDFRLALGDPYLEDLEGQAARQGRSLSNVCARIFLDRMAPGDVATSGTVQPRANQLSFSFLDHGASGGTNRAAEPKADLGVTFRDNLRQHAFGWYPYVEGFSATYTRDAILRYQPRTVYDPFGGAGTTQLAASILGIPSFYSEVNPFMAFVTEAKVNSARWARANFDRFSAIASRYLASLDASLNDRAENVDLAKYQEAFPQRDFFVERDLRSLLAACELATEMSEGHEHARALLLLACAANAVHSSNMTRRADLRRRRPDEYKTRIVNVAKFVSTTVRRIIDDIPGLPANMMPTALASADCRSLSSQYANAFELAITSPPYLNGTNYFRNTKIELWLLGFIAGEHELRGFRRQAICAGINNVSRDRPSPRQFEYVETVARRLGRV